MDITQVWTRNTEMLSKLGFSETENPGVMTLTHPDKPKVQLVASQRLVERMDLFTQFGSSPLNTPGDPLNICIGIPDHDKVFAEAVAKTVVAHFLSLNV